jgi:AAA+ superfamily predicted ATPase
MRYEQLVNWARQAWAERYPDRPYVTLWASTSVSNNLARQRLKAGRKVNGKAVYMGWQEIDCPYIPPISNFYFPARRVILTQGVGCYTFSFENKGQAFDVLYLSAYYEDDDCPAALAIALVPPQQLEVWAKFEQLANKASNYLARSQKIYVIGGKENAFEPTVEWDQVILAESLKADLYTELTSFFSEGAALYRELNLTPFRKLLLVGPPGTGKSTLCAALAKIALKQKCVVVYVSAADEEGASFEKVHRALSIVEDSRLPVLLIVEELDAYLKKEDKAQILNVLDGMETPNNPRGALLITTTNYPEVIDERIAKRPGRMDRIIYIPPIQDMEQAERMLLRYMGKHWQVAHKQVAPALIGQTGAFVREVALYARLLTVNSHERDVTVERLEQSIKRLKHQLETGDDLMPHRKIGFDTELANPRTVGFSTNQQDSD